jgi:LacI family transcriptional regulator
MSVTQQQIADKLNISRSLVARALRGHTEVAQSTREQIEAAARELGYSESSNQAARRLATMRYGRQLRTNTLALIFPPMQSSPRHIPFYMPLIEGIETETQNLGLDMCICLMRSDNLPRIVETHSVDGVVTLFDSPSQIGAMRKLGIPVVTFQGHTEDTYNIDRDDYQGIYQVTRHLLALGHRNIAFLGVNGETSTPIRLQGYLDAMKEAKIAVRDGWIDTTLRLPTPASAPLCDGCDECAACLGWETLCDKNGGSSGKRPSITAIVCHNDPVAMGVIDHAWRDGLEVPRDLSVTGFDDVSGQYHFHPEVTSVHIPHQEMGAHAVRLLHQAIENGDGNELFHQTFPTELAIHRSTAAPAFHD